MIHWGGCFSFLTFFTVQEHQRIHSYLISKYIFYPSEDVKKKCVPFCVCTLNKYWNGEMNLGCFLHKRLEDYGNLNPVNFFSQREFVEGPCFLSEGRICTTFAILYFPFTPHTTWRRLFAHWSNACLRKQFKTGCILGEQQKVPYNTIQIWQHYNIVVILPSNLKCKTTALTHGRYKKLCVRITEAAPNLNSKYS